VTPYFNRFIQESKDPRIKTIKGGYHLPAHAAFVVSLSALFVMFAVQYLIASTIDENASFKGVLSTKKFFVVVDFSRKKESVYINREHSLKIQHLPYIQGEEYNTVPIETDT
jgi:hypothetical protein